MFSGLSDIFVRQYQFVKLKIELPYVDRVTVKSINFVSDELLVASKLSPWLTCTSKDDVLFKDDVFAMLYLYRILCAVRFKSVESGVGIPYPEYAIVIPGALKHCYLKSLIFRGFWYNCNLLYLIERPPCI
jgi:hypothetical protein